MQLSWVSLWRRCCYWSVGGVVGQWRTTPVHFPLTPFTLWYHRSMQYAFRWTTFPTACVLLLALSLPGQAQSANNEEQAIRALIQDFADARNSHDGITVASFY